MDRTAVKSNTSQFLWGSALFSAMVFIPNYATHVLGANDFQVGLIVFAYAVASFLSSYIFGRLADMRGRRGVLMLGFGLSALTSLLQVLPAGPWTLLLSRALVGVTAGMIPAALLAFAYEHRQSMGRFASFGSLGWGVGSFLSGLVVFLAGSEAEGMHWSFALSSALFAVGFLFIMAMEFPRHVSVRVPFFPTALIRRNLPVFLAALIRHTGATMIWLIFPVYLEDAIGLSKELIGIIYLANTVTQFFVMRLLDRFRSESLVAAGLVISSLTFLSFTLVRSFWEVLPTQLMLGVSWACIYVGSLKFVMERNVERATAAGILGSSINLSQAVGPVVGGIVAFHFGRVSVMYVATAMAVAALVVFLLLSRKRAATND